jgi:hypothetical protein
MFKTTLFAAGFSVANLLAAPAHAKDFIWSGRTVSCAKAVEYRDKELFAQLVSAIDNFDAVKEQRLSSAIKGFNEDIKKLSKMIDEANATASKKAIVAAAGVLLGHLAENYGTIGLKTNLTPAEKNALTALATRGADWVNVFTKYGVTGDTDLSTVAAMPVSFLLTFIQFNAATKAWSVGSAAIDIATAVADAELIKGEARVNSATVRTRAEALAKKMQKPKIAELNIIKNEIDKQCG